MRNKGTSFAQYSTAVIGLKKINVANKNDMKAKFVQFRAPGQAANGMSAMAVAA